MGVVPNTPATKRTFVSLFSGCGGFDLGFKLEGFEGRGAFDIDPAALMVHRLNDLGPSHKADLSREFDLAENLQGVDVVMSGSPCQGFSTLGKRDVNDPRNHLLITAARIALRIRPRVFIAENVVGATIGEHSRYWRQLGEMLKHEGYHVADQEVLSCDYGVPQSRRRVIMLAWRDLANAKPAIPRTPGGVLRDALSRLDGLGDHEPALLIEGSPDSLIAHRIREGQKLCDIRGGANSVHTWDIPQVFGETSEHEIAILHALKAERRRNRVRSKGEADPVLLRILADRLGALSARALEPHLDELVRKGYVRRVKRRYDLRHTFNGKYRRLRWDEPSPTVDSHFANPRYFLHPAEQRGFTIREAARIQGFPDTFRFTGNDTIKSRMIANAVPVPLARAIAKWVNAALTEG